MQTGKILSFSSLSALAILLAALQLSTVPVVGQLDDSDGTFGQPSRAERQVSLLVSRLMQKDHLSKRPLDDTISKRAFEMFTRALDPTKIYFMKSDIDGFRKFETQIDDEVKRGDYSIAFNIFNTFLDRIDERVALAEKLIDEDFDFTIDEEIVTDRDLIDYPSTEADLHDRWRKRIKYNLLVLTNEKDASEPKSSERDPKERLKKRYRSYAVRMHQTDNDDLVEMFITAITTSFDPHTSYMSSESFENFMIQMRLQLEGIGATLQTADDDGYTVIKRIVPGGAADKNGKLQVEDKIVAVGQSDDGEMNDVTGMKLDDVVKQIRGDAGTKVRLEVLSENAADSRIITIVREKIKLEDSAARGVVFEEGVKPDGTPIKIGVIDLPSFYADLDSSNRGSSDARSTTRDVDRILQDFRSQDVDAVVLDLRRNGGGSLREAIDCTGLFIDAGPVVQVKNAYGEIEKYNDETPGMSWDGPLVVLTSKFSASASEILAGAVQDYGRGIVVGDTTSHGKGTVQSLLDLNHIVFGVDSPARYFGALKITMQQFYRPNGDSTQKRGVLADIVLPSITDQMDVSESDLDYPVEFDKVPRAYYRQMSLANADLIEKIRESSTQRIMASEEFKKDQEKISAYVEQKNRKSVTLNREKYLAERAKFSAEEEDKSAIEEQVNHSNLEIERTYYLDEVLQIAADYTQELGQNTLAQDKLSENN